MKPAALSSPSPETEERFELVPLAGGVQSLRSLANGQTFHPVVGPTAEAESVHVAGSRLVARANALPEGHCPVIWDVGLGAAANALAAVRALVEGYRHTEEVMLFSFDRSLGALEFALAHAETLGYPRGYEEVLRSLLARHGAELPVGETKIFWRVVPGDFPALLTAPRRFFAPHAVFFDPYSPAVNPEMWTLETFAALYARTDARHPCLLTTYTRSTAVRVALLLAGWFVGVGGATGAKDETTVATNTPGLVERPLDRRWLEKKVYASTNAAPLRAGMGYTRGPVGDEDFERLRAHPQFCLKQSFPPMPDTAPEENDLGILCPNCAASNVPEADFCARCRAPLSTMSTIDPLRSTLAEGFVYRQAVDGSPKPIVIVGIWLLFLPLAAGALLQLIDLPARTAFDVGRCGLVCALAAAVLYRSTAGFLRKRREERATPAQD